MGAVSLDEVVRCPAIPSLPAVAVRVLELASDSSTEITDIARVVQQDQGIATRVLKTVNSSYYALSTPCASIERAMALLGMNTVKSLVLGFSLVEVSEVAEDGFDLTALWRRGIYTATAAQRLAVFNRAADEDEAFTAALFQDVGMLAMFVALKDSYVDVIRGVNHGELASIEKAVFGFDHSEAGASLGERWRLPEELVTAVRHHHEPDSVAKAYQPLVRTVALAREAAAALSDAAPASATRRLYDAGRDWFQMRPQQLDGLLRDVSDAAATLAQQFGQDVGPNADVDGILAEAQELQLEHQLSVERDREASAKAAETDALTGLANRARFDRELGAAVESGSVGLVYFDADKFKSVNDTLGHAAGDAVLKALAERASETVGDAGLVCRLGGEELAVIVPGAGIDRAHEIGESVRAAMDAAPIDLTALDCGESERLVTVSVGVTAIDAGDRPGAPNADALLAEADAAVYQAKRSGRNRVCTWPVTESEAPEAPMAAAPAAAVPGEPPVFADEVVLIEDDPLSAALVSTLFRKLGAGVRTLPTVRGAEDWREQVRSGQTPRPRLVLLDHNLTGGTGVELIGELASMPELAGTRFVAFSAQMDDELAARYSRLGVHQTLSKYELARGLTGRIAQLWNDAVAA